MAIHQWRFVDPYDTNPATRQWTFPINPREMTSPFPRKNVTALTTTAVNGQALLYEGNTPPHEWTFGGSVLTMAQYEDMRRWVYQRRNRIHVYDHFGRRITCVLTGFNPTPRRSVGKYWRHDYEVSALVVEITEPTVGEMTGVGF